MTILAQDLKLMHAEEDSDFDTGGGQITSDEIEDGALGNLFDSTAELDEVQGRIKLRKFGAVVDTATTDRLQQAHLLVTEIPENPLIAATLFSTGDYFDRRPAIASHLTSYFVPAARFPAYVYGTQVEGAKAIEIWQREGGAPPEIGATYVLVENEGEPDEYTQYVMVAEAASRVDTFTDNQGDYTRTIWTITLTTRLTASFHGPEVSRYEPAANTYACTLRRVTVAQAAQYFGTRPTTAAADAGDMVVQVDTIYQQLVPAATIPAAYADLDPSARDTTLVDGGAAITFTIAATFGAGATLYLGTPFQRGSLSIATGGATLTEDGAGNLKSGSTVIGTADYAAGTITGAAGCPTYTGSKTVTLTPAGSLDGPLQTAGIEIKANTRTTSYVLTLPTQPAPGSTRIAYLSGKTWYELTDRGDGQCVGVDSSYGAAVVRFNTRTVTISLGALPDVDSWLLIQYGERSYTFSRGGTSLGKAYFDFQTTAPLVPGGTTVTWNDGTARTATLGSDGLLTGAATGGMLGPNLLRVRPNVLPPKGATFSVAITPRATATETLPSVPRNGSGVVTLTLAHGNVLAGSVEVRGDFEWAPVIQPAFTPTYTSPTFRIYSGAA